jgi:2-polyprenyl-3-methyl-5-hydroxy-6-metoxy-1,4-benzoquinol methylase
MIGRAVDRYRFIIERCQDARVLHIGCADAPYHRESLMKQIWLHDDLVAVADTCVGLDIDEAAVDHLRRERPNLDFVVGDVNKLLTLFQEERFDVVVLSEVLEHLEEPGRALRSIATVLRPRGRLIITVPNGLAIRRGLTSLVGHETIHPDHVAWYSKKAIVQLLERTGWSIDEIRGYRLMRRNDANVALLLDILASLCSEFACEGIAVTASHPRPRPASERDSGVELAGHLADKPQ